MFKGTVNELISQGGGEFDLDSLEIGHLKDRTLDGVSGGELQRIAIAMALSKDAEMYFFDEPTSYLDVRQRLRVAKMIRELGERKRVIVIETIAGKKYKVVDSFWHISGE